MYSNTHGAQEKTEGREMRWATTLAILLHAVLFGINFPEFIEQPAEALETAGFVVKPVRFRPPDPAITQEAPRVRARRVPIPDPTPNDPEPLVRDIPQAPGLESMTGLVGLEVPLPPPPPDEGPVEFTLEMIRPKRISGSDPGYTEIARRARLEGVVILSAVISRSGGVRDVEVVKPLGLGLESAALEAVRAWKFEPATLRGEPVDVIYQVTVRFSLQ